MNPQIIIAAIIAATGFGAGWQLQSWRYGAKEAQYAEQKLAQVQHSAAASIRRADNVILAQNAARSRMVRLRRDLDGALSGLDRLRLALARPVPGTSATGDACPVTDDPARQLLATCAAELVEMGGIADRHASDVQTLMAAWPTSTTKE
jgi:hypothetical protein